MVGSREQVKIQNKETARFPGDLTDTREMLRAVGQIPDHKNVVNVFGAAELTGISGMLQPSNAYLRHIDGSIRMLGYC